MWDGWELQSAICYDSTLLYVGLSAAKNKGVIHLTLSPQLLDQIVWWRAMYTRLSVKRNPLQISSFSFVDVWLTIKEWNFTWRAYKSPLITVSSHQNTSMLSISIVYRGHWVVLRLLTLSCAVTRWRAGKGAETWLPRPLSESGECVEFTAPLKRVFQHENLLPLQGASVQLILIFSW